MDNTYKNSIWVAIIIIIIVIELTVMTFTLKNIKEEMGSLVAQVENLTISYNRLHENIEDINNRLSVVEEVLVDLEMIKEIKDNINENEIFMESNIGAKALSEFTKSKPNDEISYAPSEKRYTNSTYIIKGSSLLYGDFEIFFNTETGAMERNNYDAMKWKKEVSDIMIKAFPEFEIYIDTYNSGCYPYEEITMAETCVITMDLNDSLKISKKVTELLKKYNIEVINSESTIWDESRKQEFILIKPMSEEYYKTFVCNDDIV